MRNFYLIVGIRGAFERGTRGAAYAAETAVSHTLDAWGLKPLPWGACDSGVDLDTAGPDVVRAWNHVDLRIGDREPDGDIPVSALLRTSWDALELYGKTTLSGVDAIVPPIMSVDSMWTRVAGSVIRASHSESQQHLRVLIEVGRAWESGSAGAWDARTFASELSTLVDLDEDVEPVRNLTRHAAPESVMFPAIPDAPLQATAILPTWGIDDAAWLLEATYLSAHAAGVSNDVQISLRSLAPAA